MTPAHRASIPSDQMSLIEVDPQEAFDSFPSEQPSLPADQTSLLMIVPAGPPKRAPLEIANEADTSRHRSAATPAISRTVFRRSRSHLSGTFVTGAPIPIAHSMRSAARRLRTGVTHALGSLVELAILTAPALRSRARQLTIGIARARRSAARRITTGGARALGSLLELAILTAPALRSRARQLTIGIARVRRSAGQSEMQLAQVMRSTAQPFCDRALAWRSTVHLAKLRLGPTLAIVVLASGAAVAIAGMISFSQAPSTSGQAPIAAQRSVPAPAKVSAPPPMVQMPAATREQPSSPATTTRHSPVPSVRRPQPVADTRAIQRVLNRYRDAFSILDTRLAKAVWPAVDAKALGMVFDRLKEQNVEFDSCRIAVIDSRADASCRGSVQYTPVGSRQARAEPRQWQFALRKVDRNWLIHEVNSR